VWWLSLSSPLTALNTQRVIEEFIVIDSTSKRRIILGGWSLITATVLFAGVFTYLAMTFEYPDVLDRPAGEVLPRLLSLGSTGRAVWFLYGLIPLLLLPAGIGVEAASGETPTRLGRSARWLGAISAATMMVGLLRWPTLQWQLGTAWPDASLSSRASIESTFNAANFYLGNIVGEFLGELFLNGFFLVAALAVGGATSRRWLIVSGILASAFGWVAMFRNLTPAVATIAELNNSILPLWMLMLGVALTTAHAPVQRARG
jgi:Domain of unknown function (DUF4386)